MPIQPLSDATSRIITSTQTLNNATSVIKELIDNALDARASSIAVEVASNTLDRIVVKDDGSGIGVEDRQLLCRRGYTSKIIDLDDLARLGGTFLGFRGTALASIAELSQEVTIITKVEGEQRATALTFAPNGRLLSSASASHNDGTTVRVEHFLASIPVRRQVVLKTPTKILEEIKKLLQAYAIARPTVKLSLRVLKSKTEKFNWSFAACKDKDLHLAAAIQVIGKSVTQLCRSYSSHTNDGDEDYRIEALLLAKDKDLSTAGNTAQYISVDGRPVDQEKGIMKTLVKNYKSYLQHIVTPDQNVPTKPFIILHLLCPLGSYDVNIEPAKDVVLFHDEEKILQLAERMFVECYGQIKQSKTDQQYSNIPIEPIVPSFNVLLARKKPVAELKDRSTDFETERFGEDGVQPHGNLPYGDGSFVSQFAEAVRRLPALPDESKQGEPFAPKSSPSHMSRLSHNVYAIDEEVQASESSSSNDQEVLKGLERYDLGNVAVNNPFIGTKIYSVQSPGTIGSKVGSMMTDSHAEQSLDISLQDSSLVVDVLSPSDRVSLDRARHPLTPETSPVSNILRPYQNPGPPFPRRHRRALEDEEDRETDEMNTRSAGDVAELRATPPPPQQTLLGDWVRKSALENGFGFQSASEVHNTAAGSRKLQDQGLQPTPGLEDIGRSARVVNKPFRSPLKSTPPITSSPIRSVHDNRALNKMSSLESISSTGSTGVDEDLQFILEFERKKKMVNHNRKFNQATLDPADLVGNQCRSATSPDGNFNSTHFEDEAGDITPSNLITESTRHNHSSSQFTSSKSNPHRNRYLAAVRSLQSHKEEEARTQPDTRLTSSKESETIEPLSVADPRGYLVSFRKLHQNDTASSLKAKRTKSSRLPFETIPIDEIKHGLLAVPADSFPSARTLISLTATLAKSDPYTKEGKIDPIAWLSADNDVQYWQRKIEGLIKKDYRAIMRTNDGHEQEQHLTSNAYLPLARILRSHIDSVA